MNRRRKGSTPPPRKAMRGGQPPVITGDMLHTALRCKALSESAGQIQPHLVIPAGKRKA